MNCPRVTEFQMSSQPLIGTSLQRGSTYANKPANQLKDTLVRCRKLSLTPRLEPCARMRPRRRKCFNSLSSEPDELLKRLADPPAPTHRAEATVLMRNASEQVHASRTTIGSREQ